MKCKKNLTHYAEYISPTGKIRSSAPPDIKIKIYNNELLAHGKSIQLTGDWLLRDDSHEFTCMTCGCVQSKSRKAPCEFKHSGCIKCNGKSPWKESDYKSWLSENTDLSLIGEFSGVMKETLHQCSCGNQWNIRPNNILTIGVRQCSACRKLSVNVFLEELTDRGIECTNPDDYKTTRSRLNFRCEKGHEWDALVSNIRVGTGCPTCNGCINDSMYYWVDSNDNVKIGITSYIKGTERIYACARNRETEVKHYRQIKIEDAKLHEKILHECFDGKQCYETGDGYTEFFSLNNHDIEFLNDYMNRHEL